MDTYTKRAYWIFFPIAILILILSIFGSDPSLKKSNGSYSSQSKNGSAKISFCIAGNCKNYSLPKTFNVDGEEFSWSNMNQKIRLTTNTGVVVIDDGSRDFDLGLGVNTVKVELVK